MFQHRALPMVRLSSLSLSTDGPATHIIRTLLHNGPFILIIFGFLLFPFLYILPSCLSEALLFGYDVPPYCLVQPHLCERLQTEHVPQLTHPHGCLSTLPTEYPRGNACHTAKEGAAFLACDGGDLRIAFPQCPRIRESSRRCHQEI